MSGLKFNFNKPKAAPQPPKPAPSTSKSAFDDEDEDDAFPKPSKNKSQPEAIAGLNKDLRTYTSLSQDTAARMAREALETDPSVFAYDEVYDDLKQVEIEKKKAADQDRSERKPKYMDQLLASAEVRKRDFLIAQERKYKKEREAEGDEFADKEKFVTNAYKRQQEELRKAAEEEKRKEENARKNNRGMASFYRNLLEEEETKHDLAVQAAAKAAKEGKQSSATEPIEIPREKKLADEAREVNAKLGTDAVLINDEGEVVDKRQLLKGGLNVRPKAKEAEPVAKSTYQSEYEAKKAAQRNVQKEREARQRQQRQIEDQLEQRRKRALDEEAEREEEMKLRAKSKKTSEDVMGARERYLARKKAAAQGL